MSSAENGAGAVSLSSGVTTAAREVARGENLAEARFRRVLGPPIWNESERAANWSVALVVVEGEDSRDQVLVEDHAAF